MPKHKKEKKEEEKAKAETTTDSDSGPEDRTPAKRTKTDDGGSKADSGASATNEWDLGRSRKVKINEFRGKSLIDIREYYEDKNTGETKPGKKGISLSVEQFHKLLSVADEIKKQLG